MLNYVAGLLLTYLIFDSALVLARHVDAPGAGVPAGQADARGADWPTLRLVVVVPLGFLIGIGAAVVLWVLYSRRASASRSA